ncbi:GPI biosynthesis protein Pig-F [Zychaea mexicana]|uniref:GPI biosynthesis protein Pig-F n=1 Tax=Zychaea mexicana TaxID=64656 RepID=UPI0022FE60F6|nr:GPI biosynthesis protein Pig-F [Zychaea mexicana]KAI9485113.1 GPI biosynthesis protein Pig-F [Zychaea mexicana]
MLPALPQLFAGILGIALNYVATFYMPSTRLLRDPLETLTTAIPLVLAGHIIILTFMLSVVKRCSFKTTVISIGNALLVTAVGTVVLHGFIVLFGASLVEKFNHTLAFAAYLAVLALIPSFTALSPAGTSVWTKCYLQHSPTTGSEIYAYSQTICALSGAWIGAIVLPLDWERDWQAWPISCVISTYLGHAVGVATAFGWSSFKHILNKRKSE